MSRSRRFVTEGSRLSRASAEDVMDLILDATKWSRWQPEIVSAQGPERVMPGDQVQGRARLLGFEVAGKSTTARVEHHLVEEDVIVGVRMRVTYELDPVEGGTRIVHRLEADLPWGFSGRILSVFLTWRLKRMQKKVLAELARQSEEPSA